MYIRRILTFFLYYCSFSAVIRRFIPFSCFVPRNYAAVVPDPALSRGLPLKKHHNLWLFVYFLSQMETSVRSKDDNIKIMTSGNNT